MINVKKITLLLIVTLLIGATGLTVSADQDDSFPAYFAFGENTPEIYQVGHLLGNGAKFSKIGDSNTANLLFLTTLTNSGLELDEHEYLRPVFENFAAPYNSYAAYSLAADYGWTTINLVTAGNLPRTWGSNPCRADENPVQCEYRVVRPSFAFIMIGTNDILRGHDDETFRANLNTIVEISKAAGVVPILSTIPDIRNGHEEFYGRVHKFNEIIYSVASNHGVPLWDFWAQLQSLPDLGLSGDGLHLSAPADGRTSVFTQDMLRTYGFTLRNYYALQMLDSLNLHLRVPQN